MSAQPATQPAAEPAAVRTGAVARRRRRPFWRRHGRLLAALALTGVLAVIAGAGIALARTRYLPALDEARSLKSDLAAAVATVKAAGLDLDEGDVKSLRATLSRVRISVEGLEGLVGGDPFLGLARAIPPTHDAVAGADALVAAAGHLLEAGDAGLDLADRYVTLRRQAALGGVDAPRIDAAPATDAADGGAGTLPLLVGLMATGTADVDRVLAGLEAAAADMQAMPGTLPGPIAEARDTLTAQLDEVLPLVRAYASVDETLPSMLGWDARRTYLVLAQDPAELRPTGGFIGSYGIVTVERGRITKRSFRDVFLLDLPFTAYPAVEPPAALRRYLLGETQPWQLADANWSPDFPTAAQQAVALYANEGGSEHVDGVLGITTWTIDRLLELTGPITIPARKVTIAAGETTLKTLLATRSGADGENRKAFLADFGDALIDRLLALPPSRWATLAGELGDLAADDLAQAWFADPAAQRLAAEADLDGSVAPPDGIGDLVYPVDANVAPVSKLDAVTERALDLRIVIDQVGNVEHSLGIAWTNGIEDAPNEAWRTLPNTGNTSVLGRYTRLYVPARSRLVEVSGGGFPPLTAPADAAEELGLLAWGSYLRIPPGTTTLRTSWVSPYAADLGEDGVFTYHLVLRHQPGQRPGPVDLSLALPPAATILATSGDVEVRAGTLSFHGTFTRDLVLDVRYRLPKGAR